MRPPRSEEPVSGPRGIGGAFGPRESMPRSPSGRSHPVPARGAVKSQAEGGARAGEVGEDGLHSKGVLGDQALADR